MARPILEDYPTGEALLLTAQATTLSKPHGTVRRLPSRVLTGLLIGASPHAGDPARHGFKLSSEGRDGGVAKSDRIDPSILGIVPRNTGNRWVGDHQEHRR